MDGPQSRNHPPRNPRNQTGPSGQLPDKVVAQRRQLGIEGETAAARWYQERGWKIAERNWRCGRGELDIIATSGRTVVFCEVKTRSSATFAWPAEAVNWKKQQQIRKLAGQWLEQSKVYYHVVRFDVAEVLPRNGQLEVVIHEDAF